MAARPRTRFFLETPVTFLRPAALCSLALLALAAGCSNRPSAEAAAGTGGAPAAVSPDTIKPMKSGATDATAPAETISGTVAESMDAASYTYLRVTTADRGDVWAAASKFPVAVGDRVTLAVDMPMENFHSDSLNRDFPLIYFASAVTQGAASAAGDGQALPPGHPPMGMGGPKAAVTAPTEPIAPPAGGLSVADVWAKKQSLAGQSVTVRGKVMKFNGGIMGRNWVHLQDGTGSDKDGTHDLTVTTDAVVKPGDIVTVRGTLSLDKDFTAGYKYAVILESATLVQ